MNNINKNISWQNHICIFVYVHNSLCSITANGWAYHITVFLAKPYHYNDVIMSTTASQITSLTIVYSAVYSGADQSKHQSSASLAFVWGIHRGPVNSPHKWPVTRKMFPFDDVIMSKASHILSTPRNPVVEETRDALGVPLVILFPCFNILYYHKTVTSVRPTHLIFRIQNLSFQQ